MQYLLLCFFFLYGCSPNNSARLLDKYKLSINGSPFVQAITDTISADSVYFSPPNACYYLECDTCQFLLADGAWKIRDADSLYFSSTIITPQTLIEYDGQRLKPGVSLQQLQYNFIDYQSTLTEWKYGKVLVLHTTDRCALHFRFADNKLKEIAYGLYRYD